MRFAEPNWLIAGAVVVVALFALRVRAERLTRRAIATLSGGRWLDAGALPSTFRRWLRVFTACLAVAAAFVALARPQKGKEWRTLDRHGTDLLLVLDTSKSMNADDIAPTRLERSKLAIRDLVARFPEDRIGLLAFAGDAYLESPLTLDHGALLETLNSFDTSIIGRPGTDVGRAIDIAVSTLKADSGPQKQLVLLTDGEDLQGQGLEAATRAARAGIRIDTVGVGTAAGELVPQKDERGTTVGVLHDESGNPVRSHLDESGLRAIAQAGHGTYRPLGADGGGLDRLYAEALAPSAHLQKGAKLERVYAEWFWLPLSVSVLAIALDALLGFQRRARKRTPRKQKGSHAARAGAAFAAAALGLLILPAQAHASVQSAEKAYRTGKFEAASEEYASERKKTPHDPRLSVNAAAAAYRAGHFDAAEASLERALSDAAPTLQQRVLYDLGDARYRLGTTTLKDAPEKTIERWKAAIDSYEGALKLNPKDEDARFNRDFVKRKLAELQNKQQQQQQSSNDKRQDGDSSKKEQKGDKQDQGKGDKQGQRKGDKQDQGKGDKQDQGKGDKQDQGKGSSATNPSQDGQQGDKQDASGQGKDGKDKNGQKDDRQDADGPGKDGKKQPEQGQQADHAPEQKNGSPQPAPGASAPQPHQPNGPQKGQNGEEQTHAGAPGSPSAKDARALLNSLRGDERHVRFGNSNSQNGDEAPQKDW